MWQNSPYHEVIYMKGLNWRPKAWTIYKKIDDEELLPYIIAIVDSGLHMVIAV